MENIGLNFGNKMFSKLWWKTDRNNFKLFRLDFYQNVYRQLLEQIRHKGPDTQSCYFHPFRNFASQNSDKKKYRH